MISPAVILLAAWMIVPLAMTLYFSFLRYNLLMPGTEEWTGFLNYEFFLTDPAFFDAIGNTLLLVGGVLLITIVGGILLALSTTIFGHAPISAPISNTSSLVLGQGTSCRSKPGNIGVIIFRF